MTFLQKHFSSHPQDELRHFHQVKVLSATKLTDRLFHLTTERPTSLKFLDGQFIMLGLPYDSDIILRAYSIASPSHSDTLSFSPSQSVVSNQTYRQYVS